jgi:hypothetical protein
MLLSEPTRRPRPWLTALVLLGAVAPSAAGAEPDKAGIDFFEKKIRPVLVTHCYSCHAGSTQARGGLRLDTKAGVQIGGTSGPIVVPGKPGESKLIEVLRYEGPNMPPADPLPDAVVADFVKWVEIGAPDPREESLVYKPKKIDIEAERKQWIYQTPKRPAVPAAAGDTWAWSDIDQFVRAKQRQTGTHPVGDAEPLTWLRRVTFDLVGLPPTAAQIAAVEKDSSRAAREKIVDELLASPQFGERWGRHWLDVARYAESTGKERNFVYPQAWRYRDWVIDAFNRDKPYDQFVREQIAGDLLPADSPKQRDAQVIATGFLALGPKGLNERNKESHLLDIVDEQIENVSRAVFGLSVGCARCHDHKFDPISMADYYSLAGIFRSSETKAGVLSRNFPGGQPKYLVTLPSAGKPVEQLADQKLRAEIEALDKVAQAAIFDFRRVRELATPEVLAEVSAKTPAFLSAPAGTVPIPPEVENDTSPLTATPSGPKPPEGSFEDIRQRQLNLFRINLKLSGLKSRYAVETAHLTAAAVVERPDPSDINIRLRGEADKLGPLVPRGYPQVIHVPSAPAVNPRESGRRQLAEWLTRPEHPLTARVFVNRLWTKLFGVGIVPTPDDFGDQGQKATHPELLDFLAVRFVENGWSVKKALRELVLTRTYQLRNADDTNDLAKDEANVTLWRWNRKRLDAESLRDAVLAASGRLDLTRPAGSPVIDLGLRELGPESNYSVIDRPSAHRSVYLPVLRGKAPEALAAFDLPDPSLVVGQRDATTSPGQALYLLNSPFVLEQAERVAVSALTERGLTDAGRVDLVFRSVLSRPATPAERERALAFLAKSSAKGDSDAGARALSAWTRLAQSLVALPEFRFLF